VICLKLTKKDVIGLILIILAALVIFCLPPTKYTVLTVSNIHIEPTGSGGEDPVTKEWTGDFWAIVMTTDINDQVAAYKFDKNESAKYGLDKIGDKKLVPQSTITIQIVPHRPYWERTLDAKSWNVYPKTYTTTINQITYVTTFGGEPHVEALDANVMLWGEQYWIAHTPFDVIVFKNGEEVAKQYIDTYGTTSTITLRNKNDNKEWLSIRDLGKLGTGYSEPQVGDILMFSKDTIFKYTDDVKNTIQYDASDYSYSNYWFGGGSHYTYKGYRVGRATDGSPGHFIHTLANIPVGDDAFPGNYAADSWYTWIMKPLPADIWDDKSGDSYNPSGYSLVNYLKYERKVTCYDNSFFDVWKQGWEITPENKFRIYMPYGSMSSLITIYISTQFADTIVWQPLVSNIKITSLEWYFTGNGRIGDSDVLLVHLKSESTVRASATLTATATSGQKVSLNPPSQKVAMEPGTTCFVQIEVLNTGATEETSGTVTVVVTNELGAETSRATKDYTLLPKGVGATLLTVYTEDKDTKQLVSGIMVAVNYGTKSVTEVTSDGSFTIELEGYQGSVSLSSVETIKYKSATTTKEVSKGINIATLLLESTGAEEPPFWVKYWYLIVAVIVAVVVVAVLTLRYKKGGIRKR
jgi:hypothetical protein